MFVLKKIWIKNEQVRRFEALTRYLKKNNILFSQKGIGKWNEKTAPTSEKSSSFFVLYWVFLKFVLIFWFVQKFRVKCVFFSRNPPLNCIESGKIWIHTQVFIQNDVIDLCFTKSVVFVTLMALLNPFKMNEVEKATKLIGTSITSYYITLPFSRILGFPKICYCFNSKKMFGNLS